MVLRNISTPTSKTLHRCPPVPQSCHSSFPCSQTRCGLSLCPVKQGLIPSPSLMREATQSAPDLKLQSGLDLKPRSSGTKAVCSSVLAPSEVQSESCQNHASESRLPCAQSDSCFSASQVWREVSLLSCSPHGPWTESLGSDGLVTLTSSGFQTLSSAVVKAFPD